MLGALLFTTLSAQAQDFGQNKVQYRTFRWNVLQAEHFDVYHYDSAGLPLARFTARVAEQALQRIERDWNYRITARIAIVVYNSKNDFQQTNVVSEYLPEGVGGVTELFKNRVTVPFEGDWEKFRHVVHHELVHAVINDRYYGGSIQSLITNNVRLVLPIWMNEGLAEYESLNGYDIETDMFIRDAVLGGYLPRLDQLDGYFAYRGGQAFYWYVEQTYGRQKIAELLDRLHTSSDLDAAFRSAFGKDLEEFGEQWEYDLKKLYYPDIADRQRPLDMAQPLTDHRRDESFFNTSPALSPAGDRVAWISDVDGYRSVYILDVKNPKKRRRIVEGERNLDFEELHLVTPRLTWSPDGKRIALAVKSKARDAIFLIDADKGGEEKLTFDLDAIYSVDWSPDGTKLAFQGIRGNRSDIYIYDIASGSLTNITDDIYTDLDPAWSADSRTVYFVSDRRDNPVGVAGSSFPIWNYDYRGRDLFALDINPRRLRRLTHSDSTVESSPRALPDGRLLYISDASGIGNLWVLDTATLASRPLTNVISGLQSVSPSRDGGLIAFSSWNGDGQDIFLLRSPAERRTPGDTLAPTTYLKRRTLARAGSDTSRSTASSVTVATDVAGYSGTSVDLAEGIPPAVEPETGPDRGDVLEGSDTLSDPLTYSVRPYTTRFTPDIIQATGGYTSYYGLQGVAQLLFSDMLGDQQIFLGTSILLDLKNSDFLVSYAYLPERVDYGVDAYHTSRFLYLYEPDGSSVLTRFRQWGFTGRASNPFDRFNRLDAELQAMNVRREPLDTGGVGEQSKFLLVPSIRMVHDNTTNWAFNPVSGSRWYVKLSASPKFGSNGVGFYTASADFRKYFPLSRYGDYSIGLRASGGVSFGPDPQKFYIGGVENWFNFDVIGNTLPIENAEDFAFATPVYPLRGWSLSEQIGSRYALANVEFRFPLFRALVTGPLPVLFQYVSGVIFFDAGSAWNDSFSAFHKNETGTLVTDDLLMGTGIGARAYVLGFPIKLDVAWRWDLDAWSHPIYHISLGYDF